MSQRIDAVTGSDETESFPFWTGSELARVGLLAGLLALTMSAGLPVTGAPANVTVGRPGDMADVHVAGVHVAGVHLAPAGGRVRAIRTTVLDLAALTPATVADGDHTD